MRRYTLPWPPTVNNYQRRRVMLPSADQIAAKFRKDPTAAGKWLRKQARIQVYDTTDTKEFFYRVRFAIGHSETIEGPVSVSLVLHPPDRRRRDADNTLKCLFDALERCGVVKNDSQIRRLAAEWGEPVPGGQVIAILVELEPELSLSESTA